MPGLSLLIDTLVARMNFRHAIVHIMGGIHARCVQYGTSNEGTMWNDVRGANIAELVKVADAMLAYGMV